MTSSKGSNIIKTKDIEAPSKLLLSGNEAIARGAFECGVGFVSAYPGTPSTEILENITRYREIRCEWSTNEKIALDVAIGASWGGMRALASMKHVGLNVAADSLMVGAYSGVNAGLVIISADDPGMHSSQNEQDNRILARFAKVPLLEPADSREAKELVKVGFEISERFDVPVVLRTTTRTAHSKSLVELGEREEAPLRPYEKDAPKRVVPIFGKSIRPRVEERLERLAEFSEEFPGNRVEEGDADLGIIASGVAYHHAREVFPRATFLKLALTNPLPRRLILDFVRRFEEVFVVEELEPYLEEQIRSWGVTNLVGKERIPVVGELNPDIVRRSLQGEEAPASFAAEREILPRPPVMCAGCPHVGIFYVLGKLKIHVTGDIGCYTLGTLPPFSAMHTTTCMGASVGHAFGLEIARGERIKGKVAGIIGDSTFLHAGIPGLIDMVYNQSQGTLIIADNSTTGMTGHQAHPGMGKNARGEPAPQVEIEGLVRSLGVRDVRVTDPHDLKETERVLKEALAREEVSVVISRRPCAMLPEVRYREHLVYRVELEACNACGLCYRLACPAMDRRGEKPVIDPDVCVGCALCAELCRAEAIRPLDGDEEREGEGGGDE